jgi:hypothetical protein
VLIVDHNHDGSELSDRILILEEYRYVVSQYQKWVVACSKVSTALTYVRGLIREVAQNPNGPDTAYVSKRLK